jgi:hypothetical protein
MSSTSPNNLMEQIITTQLLGRAMSNSGGNDALSIKHLLLLVLLEPIKKFADKLICDFSEINLYDMIKRIFNLYRYITIFSRKSPSNNIVIDKVDYGIDLVLSQTFWINIIGNEKYKKFIQAHKYIEKITQINNLVVELYEKWSNISITIGDNITMYLTCDYSAKWTIKRGIKQVLNFEPCEDDTKYEIINNPSNIADIINDRVILDIINNIIGDENNNVIDKLRDIYTKCNITYNNALLNDNNSEKNILYYYQ